MPNESLNLSLLCSVYLHHRHTSPIREGNREHHQAPPPTATATTTTQESQQEGTTLSGYNFARMKRCVEDIHPRARPGSFVQPATDVSATNTPPHPSTSAQRSGKTATEKSMRRSRKEEPRTRTSRTLHLLPFCPFHRLSRSLRPRCPTLPPVPG